MCGTGIKREKEITETEWQPGNRAIHTADKGAKAIQWRKSSLSTNGTGTTGYSRRNKFQSTHHTNINSKSLIGLNVISKTS